MTVTVRVDASTLQYKSEIRPEEQPDGSILYMAEIPDLPGCMSHGASVEEARQNLEDAKQEYLAALKDRGLPVPTPTAAMVGSVTWTVERGGSAASSLNSVRNISQPETETLVRA